MQRLGEKNRQKIETESQKNKLIENSVQICTIYLIVLDKPRETKLGADARATPTHKEKFDNGYKKKARYRVLERTGKVKCHQIEKNANRIKENQR